MKSELLQLRKTLHACPELGMHETHTAHVIADWLQTQTSFEVVQHVGGTGVLAIQNSQVKGPTIVLRAELDALPIVEVNQFDHKSKHPGISHKCGHDGHMTILCGVAKYFEEHPLECGTLVLLFQPAEENGLGAKAILEDPKFRSLDPDYVFALHNLPGYPEHAIILRNQTFNACVKSLVISLTGKTSHAAEPEHGINPGLAIAEILQHADSLSNNDVNHQDFAVVTPIYINMGEKAYGISAGKGEVHLTIRTWNNEAMSRLQSAIVDSATQIAAKHKLQMDYKWIQEFEACVNNADLVNAATDVASIEKFNVIFRQQPFKWGEDFGVYSQLYPTCMFGIGAGLDAPALHNPDYDFPDEITPTGVKMFVSLVKNVCK